MPIDYSVLAQPKPIPRRILKSRYKRAEWAIKRSVREQCVTRDGYCRYWKDNHGPSNCCGPSDWAHWGDRKRFKTRGMAPELRHTTGGSLKMCQKHHRAYDAGELEITADTDRGCDGPLTYRWRTE